MADWKPPDTPRGGVWKPPDTPQGQWKPPDTPQPVPGGPSGFVTGMGDPAIGAAQLASHLGIQMPLTGSPEFGMAAPIEGADSPLVSSKDIDKAVTKREQTYEAARKAAGSTGIDWTRLLGNIASPLNYMVPGGVGAGAGRSLIGTAARSALGGGAASTLEPVTGSDDFWKSKLHQAETGAAAGGILGPAASTVGHAVTRAAQAVRDRFLPAAENAARTVERRLASNPVGPTAQDVMDEVAKARQIGVPKVAADVTPELRDLGGKVFRAPGSQGRAVARDVLQGRQLGESGFDSAKRRLSRAIDTIWSGSSAYRTEKLLDQAQKAASKPLYERAEALQFIWSDRLQQLMGHKDVRAGLNHGVELEARDALAEGRPFNPTQMGLDLDADGNVKILSVPNLRVLDMAKRGLDAMIAQHRHEVTGRLDIDGASLYGLRKAFVREIDSLDKSGVYKAARDAWAGPAAQKDALEVGKKLFSFGHEEIADMMADMAPAEREAVKIGAADMLRERLMKAGFGGDQSRAILRTPWMEQHLEQLIPNAADRQKFFDRVAGEHTMAETSSKIMAGSQSAERLAEDLSPELQSVIRTVHGVRGVARIAKGDIYGGLKDVSSAMGDWAHGSTKPEVVNLLARFLFNPHVTSSSDPVASALFERGQPIWDLLPRDAVSLRPGSGSPYIGAAVGAPAGRSTGMSYSAPPSFSPRP